MRFLLVSACLALCFTLSACKKDEPPKPVAVAPAGPQTVVMTVTEDGYVPARIPVKKGQPTKFVVTRKTDSTCATELIIAGTDIKVDLPLDKAVEFTFTPKDTGEVKFGCAMDMMISGVLVVD